MNIKKTFDNHAFAIAFFCGVTSGHILTGSKTTIVERLEPDGTKTWVGGHIEMRPLDTVVAIVGNELSKLVRQPFP